MEKWRNQIRRRDHGAAAATMIHDAHRGLARLHSLNVQAACEPRRSTES